MYSYSVALPAWLTWMLKPKNFTKNRQQRVSVTNSALFNKQIAVVGVIETFDINCLYCLFSGSAATAPGSKHYKFRITIFCLLGLFFGSKCCSG